MHNYNNGLDGSLNYLPGEDLQFPNINTLEATFELDSHVSLDYLGKIADVVFSNPMIASYRIRTEVKASPFFDDLKSIDSVYYIIGDANDVKQLYAEDATGSIKFLENSREVKSLNRHNTLFLFQNKEVVGKLNTAIIDAKLDLKHYNFMWTTVNEGIDHNRIMNKQYSKTVNEHTLRRNRVLMTNAHLDKEYNNVLIKYEEGDVKFDFAYKNSINVIAAQSGNLKSTFVNNLVSAFVNPSNDLGFTFHDDDRKDGIVLLFDTETEEKKLAQMWNFHTNPNENLKYVSLKNIPKDERLIYLHSVIISFLEEGEPIRAVVIDGLLDFIVDFNNIEESERLINKVLEIIKIYDTSLFVTYQENPARYNGSNNKLSGHIGTMLHRKCESHYQTSVKGDTAEISSHKNRNEKPFTLLYDIDSSGDFLVLRTNGIKSKEKKVSQKKLDILLDGLDSAYMSKNQLTNDEVIAWIKNLINVEARAAETWKKKLVELDKIKKVESSGKFATWVRV
jgi:hypothetical protein